MGLFDELNKSGVLKNILPSGSKRTGGNKTGIDSLMNMVIGLVTKNGLNSFVDKLAKSGLKDQVLSWISTGKNKSVTPNQLNEALGSTTIDEISQKTGMEKGTISKSLSKILPEIIDKLTPEGKVDEQHVQSEVKGIDLGDIGNILGNFFKK